MTHFLDRTDPTFCQDLKRSVVQVNHVAERLNEYIKNHFSTYHNISNLTLRVMDTRIRPDASQRKAYSDSGDVEVTWLDQGIPKRAILEFKQRAGYKFEKLADFKFDTIWVDALSKFERIRKRNDTLGYVLTDQYMKCLFATCMNVFADKMKVEEVYFRSRPTKRCLLHKQYFHEGIHDVCHMIMQLAANFEKHGMHYSHARKVHRQLKLTRRKIKDLEFQLTNLRKLEAKIQVQMAALPAHVALVSPTYVLPTPKVANPIDQPTKLVKRKRIKTFD